MLDTSRPPQQKLALTLLTVWFILALALGASGIVEQLRPPAPQIILLFLTATVILVGWRVSSLHAWAMAIGVRPVVALHLTRGIAGAYFLVLGARGVLPTAFARPAGWGDIAVALLAALLLASTRPDSPPRQRAYQLWNLLGALDLLFVVATAARLAMASPTSMQAMQRLPLSLLITFLVPLLIASHVLLAVRLRRPIASPIPAPVV